MFMMFFCMALEPFLERYPKVSSGQQASYSVDY